MKGMNKQSWYDLAWKHVTECATGYETDDIKDLEKYIRKNSYRFGERKMWPYKMWCKAVNDYMKQERVRRVGIVDDYSALPLFGND